MANQYHDELGRFCSRNEMGEAVDRLFTLTTSAPTEGERAVASEQWFTLKNEYETILSKPETTEEKLQNFLTGETDRDITYESTRRGMLKLLVSDDYKGEAKIEDIRRLIDELKDERDGGAGYLTSVFESNKLTFDDKYKLAKKHSDGLTELAQSVPQEFFANSELEAELIEELQKNGKKKERSHYAEQLTWTILARSSARPETRALLLKGAEDETNGDTELPAIELAKNPNLTQEEALDLLETIAAHQPDDWGKAIKAMERGALQRSVAENFIAVDQEVDGLRAAHGSPAERHQTWRRNAFRVEDDRDMANYLLAKAKIEMKTTQFERPNAWTVLSFAEGNQLTAVLARADANQLADVDKQLKVADKERKRRKVYGRERDNLFDNYFQLKDRAEAARKYRRINETVAELREELKERAQEAKRLEEIELIRQREEAEDAEDAAKAAASKS